MTADRKIPANWLEGLELAEKIRELVKEALYTDGAHHKQWYLEEIGKLVGINLDELRVDMAEEYGEWEPGKPP